MAARNSSFSSEASQERTRRDSLILVHLPFDEHSKVFVRPGVSAKDAIMPILKKRNIIPDLCSVCADADPKSPEIDLQMDLECLSQNLVAKELWVHAEYKDWEIPNESVIYGARIGSGSFGTVYKADYFGLVAVKRLNVTSTSEARLGSFKNEAALLRKARHPNVLNFVGVICKPMLAIVTEWCSGESLYRRVHVHEPPVEFTTATVISIARQISQGMEYLHSRGILHRDLKSNNIFLSEQSVKIGDFGLATMRSLTEGDSSASMGSVLWMAPEVIRTLGIKSTQHSYSPLSDVYSFGICLYEMLTRRLPYSIQCRDQILYMVGSGLMRPELDDEQMTSVPDPLIVLYLRCVTFEMDSRPDFRTVTAALMSIETS